MPWKKEETPPVEVILGKCPAKANKYRIGKGNFYTDDTIGKYEASFALQCRNYRNKNISVPFELHITAFFKSRANDLDNILKTTLDCLQQVKAISNDNLCVHINARKLIDKKNPRIEFYLKAA